MKYKAKSNLLLELSKLPYFTKERVFQLGTNEKTYNLKEKTIDTYISRFLRDKPKDREASPVIALKRALYVTREFYEKNKYKTSYLFYIANVLRKPSYISSWTALQYYGLATEVIHTMTSVTTKVTKTYKTKIGTFSYQSIKKDLFSDFLLINDGDFHFFIATPSKALFDLLYFKTKQLKGLSMEDIIYLLEELRIDIDEMEKDEREKFFLMVKSHLNYE